MIEIAFPLAQPGRSTTSWIRALRSGVRWAGPAWFCTHAPGDQLVDAVVRGRDETLPRAVVKVAALSAASAWTVRLVTSVLASRATSWIHAA
jgi:hypothetical protein